jgi:peptidoglycan-N-acetylglucosamine deacetylase
MKRRYYIQGIFFFILVLITYGALQNGYTKDYFSVMKNVSVSKVDKNDPLYKKIQESAHKYESEPQNAKMDPVWKKMPGINGLKVDVAKSFTRMKKKGTFDEKLLVINEVEPEVTLEDLPAGPIYRGHPDKQMVSFLINVSWGEEYIPDMLKILRENKAKATFFIDGAWAQKNVDLVKMIAEEGHFIGSHGYNHPDMKKLSKEQIKEQLVKTNSIIKTIADVEPVYFAPPAGSFNQTVVNEAHELGMETILWTVDTVDWKNPTKSLLLNRVLSKIEPGSMILMHPKAVTRDSLEELILKIKEKNYKIGTVGKLLAEDRS